MNQSLQDSSEIDPGMSQSEDSAARNHGAPGLIARFCGATCSRFGTALSIDLRALALFRIGMAYLILLDLYRRAYDLSAHYSDSGIMPRHAVTDEFSRKWRFSLHLISGEWQIQGFLFLVAAFFAFLMLIGYRTRLATVVSWFLLTSLHSRNTYILNGGDTLMRLLIFWAMFLPLGAAYSVDRALTSNRLEKSKCVLSIASSAFILQFCMMYLFTAIMKNGEVWIGDWEGVREALGQVATEGFKPVFAAFAEMWRSGFTAVYYSLQIDQIVKPAGELIRPYPLLLKIITVATIILEWVGPLIVLIPVWMTPTRILLVLSFVLFHLGLYLTMEIGLFPWVCILMWMTLLPTAFWDWLDRRMRPRNQFQLKIIFYNEGDYSHKLAVITRTFLMLGHLDVLPSKSDDAAQDEYQTHNTWLVVRDREEILCGFDGLLRLAGASPGFRWLRPLGALRGTHWFCTNASGFVLKAGIVKGILNGLRFRPIALTLPYALRIFVLFTLIYVIMWNIRSLDYKNLSKTIFPKQYNSYGYLLRLEQSWSMFRNPLKGDGWYVIKGELVDGTEFDYFSRDELRPVSWDKPARVSEIYPNARWSKFLRTMSLDKHKKLRTFFARYVSHEWNTSHSGDDRLYMFWVYFNREYTLPDYETKPIAKKRLIRWRCLKEHPKLKDAASEKKK